MQAFSDIFKCFQYRYKVQTTLSDIEKVFNYLNGTKDRDTNLMQILNAAEEAQQTKNIECTYFTLNFYKKGTVHIKFKDKELLKKFNIFGGRQKRWLPPAYGKKAYEDMTQEEQMVVDEFEGKDAYAETYAVPDKYLHIAESMVLRN